MSEEKEAGVIYLHFDVTEHQLPLKQFIDAAKSTQEIIDNFNKEFFEGKLKYEINVIPPQDGGFVDRLKVIVSAVPPIVLSVWDKDVRAGVIEGLTGKQPAEWAKDNTKDAKVECSELVGEMTLGFIQKAPDALRKIGLPKDKFRAAYKAKNKIYNDCLTNKDVKALGFDSSHDFSISRNDFVQHIIDLPPEEEIEEDYQWTVSIEDIVVNSPNWKRDGNRKWQGSTAEIKDIAFSIEDETFWHHVKVRDINPDINDNMQVQWAYQKKASKPSNVRVLSVLNYNGTKISEPIEDVAKVCDELSGYLIEEKEQPSLFSYDNTKEGKTS